MDLVCTRCGEPWDMHHVLHDEPESFKRQGCAITRCPACPMQFPAMKHEERRRLGSIRALAVIFADDIDGFASTLEDYGLV